jgi:hypothetical protein
MQVIPIYLEKPYQTAFIKYGWERGVEGFCIEYNMLQIAHMAGKTVEFSVKRRRKKYRIEPEMAQMVAKEHKSFFTNKMGKVVVVVPANRCEVIT